MYTGEVLLFRFGLVFTNVINHFSFLVDIAENNSCWMHWNPEQGHDNADIRPTLLLA